jgi:hypothetical protein
MEARKNPIEETATMGQADAIVERVREEAALHRPSDYRSFLYDFKPSVRDIDVGHSVETAEMRITFSESPTAAALARALDETDREARRVVAGFERGVRPERLRGRGVRLVPPQFGLRVERADAGSLDVLLAFGGLYEVVTSQPLSFALNLAALRGYGKAVLRAVKPGSSGSEEISIPLPTIPTVAQTGELPEGVNEIGMVRACQKCWSRATTPP